MQYLVPIDFTIIERIKVAFTLFKVTDFIIIEHGGMNVFGLNFEHSILKHGSLPEPIEGMPNLLYVAATSMGSAPYKEQKYYLYNSCFIIAESEIPTFNYQVACMQLYSGYHSALCMLKELETLSIYSIEHIQKDPSFAMDILSMRAADGVRYYNYNGHMMSLYVGILPITSTDDVQLDIFENKELPYFIGRFTIKKKTGAWLRVYLRFLKINRSPVA